MGQKPLPKTFEALERMEAAGLIPRGWQAEEIDEYMAALLDRLRTDLVAER